MTQASSCVFRRSAYAALGFVALTLLTAGCSSTAKIAQSSMGNVYLEEVTDWSFEANHPAVIDHATMMKIVKGLYRDESQNGPSRMSAGGGKPMRIFSDEDAEFLAPLLAHGLSRAKPEQIVGFRLSSSAGSGVEPTAGSIYVQKESIYFTIAGGAKPAGFMPESAAHIEHAPPYAAGGTPGMLAMVIDYHALAKAPVSSLPVAKAAPAAPKALQVPAAAPITAAAQVKPQTVSNQSAAAMMQSEFQSPEINQADKAKETIAKKESEINMLRKEAAWMKRELRERDEEIKALKTSKVSAKPAPKKKRTEVYPMVKPSRPISPNVDEFGLK